MLRCNIKEGFAVKVRDIIDNITTKYPYIGRPILYPEQETIADKAAGWLTLKNLGLAALIILGVLLVVSIAWPVFITLLLAIIGLIGGTIL